MRYDDRPSGSNGRDPDTIQRDIEHTRRELDRTLEAIQQDLSPSELIKQLLDRVRGGDGSSSMSDTASRVLSKIKDNPIPSALIAIGVLALAKDTGPSAGDIREAAGRGRERVRSAAERVRGGGEGGGSEAGERARELAGSAAGSAKEKAAHARESFESGYERVRERIEDNPIVLGALGVALGAALGAGLPRTRFEDERFGATRDELVSGARDTVSETKQSIQGSGEGSGEPIGHPVHAPIQGYDPSSRSVGEPSDEFLIETERKPRE